MKSEPRYRWLKVRSHDTLALAHEAANTSPNSADAWRALGATLAAAKRFAEAADPLRRALALDPDSPFAIVALTDVLFLDGKKSEAKSHYERVVALCRDDSTWTSQVVRRAREQLQFMELESGLDLGLNHGVPRVNAPQEKRAHLVVG